jgi:release factor glutamine methyltransferase
LITNKINFYGLDFKILKGILIPRPDTEVLCEKVIHILKQDKKLKKGADLCCGSGNIGIVLKKNIKNISMDGIDIQKIACRNTILNSQKHHVDINVFQGDFYKTMIKKKLKYDFIVCNPPYVSIRQLDKKMLQYENKMNFINSKDPLFFYKQIINNFKKIVRNDKHFLLAFEIGYDQKSKLMKYIKQTSLSKYTSFYKDYNNQDRVMLIYLN